MVRSLQRRATFSARIRDRMSSAGDRRTGATMSQSDGILGLPIWAFVIAVFVYFWLLDLI